MPPQPGHYPSLWDITAMCPHAWCITLPCGAVQPCAPTPGVGHYSLVPPQLVHYPSLLVSSFLVASCSSSWPCWHFPNLKVCRKLGVYYFLEVSVKNIFSRTLQKAHQIFSSSSFCTLPPCLSPSSPSIDWASISLPWFLTTMNTMRSQEKQADILEHTLPGDDYHSSQFTGQSHSKVSKNLSGFF